MKISEIFKEVEYLDLTIKVQSSKEIPREDSKAKRSLTILLGQVKEHHDPLKKRVIITRKNMIGEISSQPRILNEPDRIERLTKAKKERKSEKRKLSKVRDGSSDQSSEDQTQQVLSKKSEKKGKKQSKKVKLSSQEDEPLIRVKPEK
jgi:hypothetical protein